MYKSVRFLCLPLRGRHAQWSCPTIRLSHPRRRARPLGAPVQALPILYKPVHLHRLPLRSRWTYLSTLQPPGVPALCEKILQDAKKGLTSVQRYDILSEQSKSTYARVVELADSLDSGSSVHSGRAGSTPASRTMKTALAQASAVFNHTCEAGISCGASCISLVIIASFLHYERASAVCCVRYVKRRK